MDIIICVAIAILLILGIIGAILPFPPGPPLAFVGFWMIDALTFIDIQTETIIYAFIAMIIIEILDFYMPVWFTKKFGGSKAGVWGSIAGLVLGMLFGGPLGIIVGSFIGAFVGEFFIERKNMTMSLKSSFGSFIGFLTTTALKVIYGGYAMFYFIKEVWSNISFT